MQGVRRELNIDLDSVSQLRPEIVALAAGIADLPVEQRQVALAESGLLAPHWPKPYGGKAGPAEQLLIDQELDRAGVQRPDLVIGWWAVPTILEFGTRTRSTASSRRHCVARSSGASCSVSRRRVRISRRCVRKRFVPRRLEAHRPEGMDIGGAEGALGNLSGPNRRRGAQAQGHHLLSG